jgi:hypothetical protein
VAGIEVFGIASVTQPVAFLQGEPLPPVDPIEMIGRPGRQNTPTDVWTWQMWLEVKWACEVAAAGRHTCFPRPVWLNSNISDELTTHHRRPTANTPQESCDKKPHPQHLRN